MLAIRRDGYFCEPTPVTKPELAHEAPPLPPLPESVMTQVAHHPSPKFPWYFVVSLLVNALLAFAVVHGIRR